MITCPRCGSENPDANRFCGACGATLVQPATEARKRVTVLFADVVDSTPLGERIDPEALRLAMARFFELTRSVLEAHGGTVEKFIGDAVMAVFGIPLLHEDDALRAVRAAAEARGRLDGLNEELEASFGITLRTRTGINTGEVVVGEGETLVTGDAVNVAARLEQAAGGGEILIGETTYELVRDAVEAEPTPLALKGKSETAAAYRLLGIRPGRAGFERRLDSPLVGRERELRLLGDTFEQAVAGRSCHLVTVLGQPGVGKTRLVEDFVASLDAPVRVVRGRCLPYGDGITYWPLREAVLGLASGDHAGARERLAKLLPGAERELVADRVAQLVGIAEGSATAEEGHWAVRKLFEALARDRPLIAVLDDLQWAEPALLDLVEHVADWSRDAPGLLVCVSRPELLEARHGWGGGKLNALSLLLNPLDAHESETLVGNLLGGQVPEELRVRVAAAAEGNPLYVEELLRMLVDGGSVRRANGGWEVERADELVVPPTIQALLAVRIDTLPAPERATLAAAAVEGKVFHVAAVAAVAARGEVDENLGALVRKELIRPHPAPLAGEEAYSFHHQLVRDAAYAALPKRERAHLHERFADWLERRAGDRTDVDEILGYHLEQAHRYRVELAPPDERSAALAGRASCFLQSAGRRAYARGDVRAARALLEHGSKLASGDPAENVDLAETLAAAHVWTGDIAGGIALLRETVERAIAAGDDVGAVRARLSLVDAYWIARPDEALAEMAWVESEAIPQLERLEDHALLARAWRALFQRDWSACRGAEAAGKARRAAAHARLAGDRRLELDTIEWVFTAQLFGPAPAVEGIAVCDAALAEAGDEPISAHMALNARAGLSAYQGRFDEARADHRRCLTILEDLGRNVIAAVVGAHVGGLIEQLAGDLDAAEERMRRGVGQLRAFGERSFLSTTVAHLAEVVYRQGRLEDADDLTRESEAAGSADDIATQASWRQVRAKIAARRGELPEAERLAREAVALWEPTDWLVWKANAARDLAEVLAACGQGDEAESCLEQALALYERKGDLVDAARMRELLAAAGATPS